VRGSVEVVQAHVCPDASSQTPGHQAMSTGSDILDVAPDCGVAIKPKVSEGLRLRWYAYGTHDVVLFSSRRMWTIV
jgi:hypothetical protein